MVSYRAVGDRCAVHFPSINLPISQNKALEMLAQRGFERLTVDIIALGRKLIGNSVYKRGARMYEAPDTLDCSSLTKWLYAQQGIWIPRRSIQQREHGVRVSPEEVMRGDLLFTSGHIDYYLTNSQDGVGHVGIVTGEGTVIHAANKMEGIIETQIEKFINNSPRGATRVIPVGYEVVTLKTPQNREIEISEDIRWILLQNL
ncbi:MAG: NlpC/P60 family protein [Nanoarchaeota archaeon]